MTAAVSASRASRRPGYDYDTFAADLKALLDHLALDQDVVLAGFSMGTGEVTRYLGTYGSAGVSKAVLLGVDPAVPAPDRRQPEGRAPGRVRRHQADRRWPTATRGSTTSSQLLQHRRARAGADRRGGAAGELPGRRRRVAVRVLCVRRHVADRLPRRSAEDRHPRRWSCTAQPTGSCPFEATAARLRDERLIADLTVVEIADGPHNIGWTYPEETNAALLEFLSGEPKADSALAVAAPSSTTSV